MWHAAACALREEAEQIGDECAGHSGRARAAGLDPALMSPLVAAAVALYAPEGDLPPEGWPRYPADRELLEDSRGALATVVELGRRAAVLADRVQVALAAALMAQAAAYGQDPPDMVAAAAAAAEVADCEAALAVLRELIARLREARGALGSVPAAFLQVYGAPDALVASGRLMPFDGRFIVPARRS